MALGKAVKVSRAFADSANDQDQCAEALEQIADSVAVDYLREMNRQRLNAFVSP